jgi:hypothetical protein
MVTLFQADPAVAAGELTVDDLARGGKKSRTRRRGRTEDSRVWASALELGLTKTNCTETKRYLSAFISLVTWP